MLNASAPELLWLLLMAIFMWGMPIAAGVWIIVTLVRIRHDHAAIQAKLEAIERAIAKQP